MDKRLAKRYRRQVTRARDRVRVSEPDLRTPEQIQAARERSRPTGGHNSDGSVRNSTVFVRSGKTPGTGSAAKTDA